MSRNYTPEWLQAAMGERERRINDAPDAKVMQCLPECWEPKECRLPAGQVHIVSLSLGAHFTIDGPRRAIIG